MLDEMKDRYEQIKDDLEPKVDKRLLECGLKELDYIEFLNDQEFTQITLIMRAVQDDKISVAYGMCKQLLDDIVCYGQLINDARDCSLYRMECGEDAKHFEDYMNPPQESPEHHDLPNRQFPDTTLEECKELHRLDNRFICPICSNFFSCYPNKGDY